MLYFIIVAQYNNILKKLIFYIVENIEFIIKIPYYIDKVRFNKLNEIYIKLLKQSREKIRISVKFDF